MDTILEETVNKLVESFRVDPKNYTKPIRVYCDVDGVIQPFIYEEKDLEKLDGSVDLEYIDYLFNFRDQVQIKSGLFCFRQKVVDFLSELSTNVDFVWLTHWRMNAPRGLDPALGIKSLGYVPWALKRSDYNHVFKLSGIMEDQAQNPSQFIWIEDVANIPRYRSGDLFKEYSRGSNRGRIVIPKSRYLSINTDSFVGLTDPQMLKIQKWIEKQS